MEALWRHEAQHTAAQQASAPSDEDDCGASDEEGEEAYTGARPPLHFLKRIAEELNMAMLMVARAPPKLAFIVSCTRELEQHTQQLLTQLDVTVWACFSFLFKSV